MHSTTAINGRSLLTWRKKQTTRNTYLGQQNEDAIFELRHEVAFVRKDEFSESNESWKNTNKHFMNYCALHIYHHYDTVYS